MNLTGWTPVLLQLAGGLAVFIFAIRLMTRSLHDAAGRTLRSLVRRTTRGPISGVTIGTLFGFLLHSTATTVILVGFLHAGLLTLASAIPPILGANLGTTFSMQLISLSLGKYYAIPIALGLIIVLSVSRRPWTAVGESLCGFGLLFLGMQLMSGAVAPHRELLRPLLAEVHGAGLAGQLASLGIAALVTIAIQSSGATIGILFALIEAGAFTHLAEVFPLVLGAHIGTCSTAMIGSLGTSVEGRRGAIAHLVFNILTSALALALQSFLLPAVETTSTSVVRQTANLHTAVMALGIVVFLPGSFIIRQIVLLALPSRAAAAETSHLDDALLDKPEQAIVQSLHELQRVARICRESFRLNAQIMFRMNTRMLTTVRRNEDAVDEIQRAVRAYLASAALRYLSRRQMVMIQHVTRCMTDIERIGDHNDNLADLAEARQRSANVAIPADAQERLFDLFQSADRVLSLVIDSLSPEHDDFQAMARQILQARDDYAERSLTAKAYFTERTVNHDYASPVSLFISDYIAEFDRIVRHSKMIALAETQPYFWIKRRKLDRIAPEMPEPPDAKSEPHDFLDKLQQEGFV